MAIVVVIAALVGAGVWGAVLLEGHLATPVRPAARRPRRRGHPVPCQRRRSSGPAGPLHCLTPAAGSGIIRPPAARATAGRVGRLWASRPMAARRGPGGGANLLAAAVLLAIMLGGTLPVPLYLRSERHLGSGPAGGHGGLRRLRSGHPGRAGSAG